MGRNTDKYVDYLSRSEEELISLRKRKYKAKNNPTQTNKNRNTQEARCSRPKRVYDVGKSETVRDQQGYMDNLNFHLRDGDV